MHPVRAADDAIFAGYRVLRLLGRGGMADVHLVEHSGPIGNRIVRKLYALKRIRADYVDDPERVSRFLAEMQLATALEHPNVVQVVDFGQHEGTYFLVLEFVRGADLRTTCTRLAAMAARQTAIYAGQEQGRLPPVVTAFVGMQAAIGLEYLHRQRDERGELGLVHRDVSPDNLFLDVNGTVKVGDFGIAKALRVEHTPASATGAMPGKPLYMAPEQLEGAPLDGRLDLYALGVSLFELVSGGAHPYDDPHRPAEDDWGRVGRALRTDRAPIARLLPGVPAPVTDVLEALIQGRRDQRLGSATEAVNAFRNVIAALGHDIYQAQQQAQHLAGLVYEAPDTVYEMPGADNGSSDELQESTKRPVTSGAWSASSEDRPAPPPAPVAPASAATAEKPAVSAQNELPPHTIIAERYRIVRKIGQGGMGAVYEVEHVAIGRRLAVKVVHAHFAAEADIVTRFQREARAATTIGHPHIVEVTDFGRLPDGRPFMVLEYLEGRDWDRDIEAEGPQPLQKVARIVSQVCDALQAAHTKGIIHRDLKPENIFLTRRGDAEFVKVVDFGISKFMPSAGGDEFKATQTGIALGTPYYMSPEQCRGARDLDHRTDIYALGVLMFRALTCEHPFRGDTYPQLVLNIATAQPPPLTQWRKDIPTEVCSLVERMLSKHPDARPQSCAEIARTLLVYARDGARPDHMHLEAPDAQRTVRQFVGAAASVSDKATDARAGRKPRRGLVALTGAGIVLAACLGTAGVVLFGGAPRLIGSREAGGHVISNRSASSSNHAQQPRAVEPAEAPTSPSTDERVPTALVSPSASSRDVAARDAGSAELVRLPPSRENGRPEERANLPRRRVDRTAARALPAAPPVVGQPMPGQPSRVPPRPFTGAPASESTFGL